MKKTILFTLRIAIVILCFCSQIAQAQFWGNFLSPPNSFNQPDYIFTLPTPESVGIGDFNGAGAGAVPLSALHVNSNWLPPSIVFRPGDVFRTDCPIGSAADPITRWRMFRNNAGGPIERGTLWNPWQTVPLVPPCPLCPPSLYLTPNDLILDAPTGSFIVQGWSHDNLSGNDVLKEKKPNLRTFCYCS